MKTSINIQKHIDNSGLFAKSLNRNNQALAFSVPYIIENDIPGFKVLHLENGKVVLESVNNKRYRVVTSQNYKFDVSPSFAKGSGRSKEGISSYKYHLSQICDGVAFVCMKDKSDTKVIFKDLTKIAISEEGIVNLDWELK